VVPKPSTDVYVYSIPDSFESVGLVASEKPTICECSSIKTRAIRWQDPNRGRNEVPVCLEIASNTETVYDEKGPKSRCGINLNAADSVCRLGRVWPT
jgi:hypothetical protein